MNHPRSHQSGFTLIESLVAISILVTVIIGTTSAVQRGLSSYQFSKDQITAFYLAQEGFEQIKNIRDENVLNGSNWLAGLAEDSGDPCWYGNACTVDPANTNFAISCSPSTCPLLRQDATSGWYGYTSSWAATRFTREILLAQVNANEISVTVNITWNQGGTARTFTARENLLNWH